MTSYELNKQIKELEAAIKADPDCYFVEGWQTAITQLRAQSQQAYIAEQKALEGKTYNVVLDTWE